MDAAAEQAIARLWGEAHEELHSISTVLRVYLQSVCGQLTFEQETGSEVDFRYRTIDEPRVKPFRSVLRRIPNELDPGSIWEIDDLVGARVVVISPCDVSILVDRVCKDATTGRSPIESIEPQRIDDASGYRATHIKGRYRRRSGGTVGCEIQIRTALLDMWAVLSRHDLYLREDLPTALSSRARDQARYLVTVDEILDEIRQTVRRTPMPDVEAGPETGEPQVPDLEPT